MARTALFQKIRQYLRQAAYSNRHALSDTELSDKLATSTNISRRKFNKGLLYTAGSYSLSALSAPLFAHDGERHPSIAIIGAGLSGLTAAYRLAQAGIIAEVFDAHPYRLGGRIWTKRNFNAEGMFCELGGELVDTGHVDIQQLCWDLELNLQTLDHDDDHLLKTFYFIHGSFRDDTDIIRDFQPLADAINNDIGFLIQDGELQFPSYQNTLGAEALDQLTLKQWLEAQQNKVEAWVLDLLEIAYVEEMGADAENQPALNLLLVISTDTQDGFDIFGASDQALRIDGGSDTIISALYQQIASTTQVNKNCRLIGIKETARKFRLSFARDDITIDRYFDKVIFAMPFSVLRQVEGIFDLPLSPVKKTCIAEFGMGINTKIMVGFATRFWRQGAGNIPASSGSFFSDIGRCEYWETSRRQPGDSGILTRYLGGSAARLPSKVARRSTLDDLDTVWSGLGRQYHDGHHAFMAWEKSPYQLGSYSTLLAGQWTSIYGSASEPEANGRLLFAGEQSSDDYFGTMNGAVQAGNTAAMQIINTV